MPDPSESRFNAVKHGCCAKSPVLPGESEEAWRELAAEWFDDYHPETPVSRVLVGEAVLAFWQKARNRRQFEHYERSLAAKDSNAWTDVEHLNYSRFLRYKTAADRAFNTAFKNLEYLRKAYFSEDLALLRMKEQVSRLELAHARLDFDRQKHAAAQAAKLKEKPAASAPPRQEIPEVVDQWVDVHNFEGVTVTQYVPTNAELLATFQEQQQDPRMIRRLLHFPFGVPPEYHWTGYHAPDTCEDARQGRPCSFCVLPGRPNRGNQRIPFDTWLKVIVREHNTPGQHAGPMHVTEPNPNPEEADNMKPTPDHEEGDNSPNETNPDRQGL